MHESLKLPQLTDRGNLGTKRGLDDIIGTTAPLGLIGANIDTNVRTLAWEVGREGVIHPSNLSLMVTHFGAQKARNILCEAQRNI